MVDLRSQKSEVGSKNKFKVQSPKSKVQSQASYFWLLVTVYCLPITAFRFLSLCSLFFALCCSGCVKNPVTGQRELHMISENAELRLGEESQKEIVKEYGLFQNPDIQSYINEVGHKIVSVCERKNISYDFVILDTSLVNAFAVPGAVFLTRGILDLIDDEAELAAVIGHEVGHITGYHAVKLIQKSYGYGFLATFAAVAGTIYAPTLRDTKEYTAYYETLYRGIGLVTAGFLTGYGREFELEADRSGLRYGILAGYDPDAMISFFKRLQSLEQEEEGGLAVFLRTHPPTKNRIKQTRDILTSLEEDQPTKKKDPEVPRKLSSILKSTSTVLTDHFSRYHEIVRMSQNNAEEPGVIKGNIYENSRIGVRLEAPKGWKMEFRYGRSLVKFISSDGKAEGELQYKTLQPDPVLAADSQSDFAGTVASTEVLTSAKWAETIESGLRMEKRMGREVTYPCGLTYVATYKGRDRLGRPAYYKTLYMVRNKEKDLWEGFMISCAAPEDIYLDYLVDFEKIMRSFTLEE